MRRRFGATSTPLKDYRLTIALGAACAVHIVVLGVGRRSRPPQRALMVSAPAQGEPPLEFDLEALVLVSSSGATSRPLEDAPAAVRTRAATLEATRVESPAGSHRDAEQPNNGGELESAEGVPEVDREGAAPGSEGWSFNPVRAELRLPTVGGAI